MMKRSAITLRLPKWSKLKILSWVSRFCNFCYGPTTRPAISQKCQLLLLNRDSSHVNAAQRHQQETSRWFFFVGHFKCDETCEKALWGALAAGRENEGELVAPRVAPRRLCCQISANRREAERSANVSKHWKARVNGNDVITNVISANQHVASTFSMQIFKFQRRSCNLSFLFPPHHQSAPKSLLAG